MSVRLRLDGLAELKAQLRQLPADLASAGADRVQARADRATARITAGYPVHAGELRDGMTVVHTRSAFGAQSIVRNSSPHAAPFEVGTEARHTRTGWNRGAAPPNHLFTQIVMEERRALFDVDLRAVLTQAGLVVTGTP